MMASKSVCQVGCLISSVASGMASLGKTINSQTTTPGTLHYLKSNNGYQGNLFSWGAVSRFGLKYEGQPDVGANIRTAICAKKIVILNVNNGGHWVLATGWANGQYLVVDSGYSRVSYSFAEVSRAGVFSF